MPLSYNNNIPQGNQAVSSTQLPILTNFQSVDSAFNGPTGAASGGGNFSTYALQNVTQGPEFAIKPANPVGVVYTQVTSGGNPELAYINNINANPGAAPFQGVRITGGGISAAAYVSMNGATGAVIAGSAFNVGATARIGVGDYSVTFSRNFINAAYVALITPNMPVGGVFAIKVVSVGKLVNQCNFQLQNQTNGFTDAVTIDLVFFGTLV